MIACMFYCLFTPTNNYDSHIYERNTKPLVTASVSEYFIYVCARSRAVLTLIQLIQIIAKARKIREFYTVYIVVPCYNLYLSKSKRFVLLGVLLITQNIVTLCVFRSYCWPLREHIIFLLYLWTSDAAFLYYFCWKFTYLELLQSLIPSVVVFFLAQPCHSIHLMTKKWETFVFQIIIPNRNKRKNMMGSNHYHLISQ